MAKPKSRKRKQKFTSNSPYSDNEVELAAHYFCCSNMCAEIEKMTPQSIMGRYYELECDMAVETEWMDEVDPDENGGLHTEVDRWRIDMQLGKGYAHDEWTKLRKTIEGIELL